MKALSESHYWATNKKKSKETDQLSPFKVLVRKEVSDHVHSWRFILLLALVLLTFFASMYISMSNIRASFNNVNDPDHAFLYLKLLSATDGSMPPFHILMSFLAPLLGITMGFDAINSEQNSGSLTRLLAQPVYRDNILLAKFYSAMLIISTLFISLTLLMIGGGLFFTGVRIESQEFLRIIGFSVLTIVYVGFYLSLSIMLSVAFRHASTSALTALGIWLFFTVFYPILVNLAIRAFLPDAAYLTQGEKLAYNELIMDIMRVAPGQLYSDGATTMLMPSIRSLGPMSMEQLSGAIPSPLPLRESLIIVWPQLTGLLAGSIAFFALSYYLFMRREIRS
ncbi:ABC transporter permease [Pedobacter suwonensis]|uniref:ABC transporter permease n=1 Tax=Pedobacter suwonensis TaxID=332999 RepID=UPI0011A199B7|nr:ABC transporter permease subunit [Pedobacter suwonensis]